MAVDPDATSLSPHGLALDLLVITLFFIFLCSLIVVLRCWIKIKQGNFGVDDGLMLIGWVIFLVDAGIVARGTYIGMGTTDEHLNDNLQMSGRKSLWLFQLFYGASLLFIKGSICVTLLRIAVQRSHRIVVWVMVAITCTSSLIVIIYLLVMCRPIAASWDSSVSGTCAPVSVVVNLTYLVSAMAVLTDWICAILPGLMLYKAQMKTATKVSITVILGLGVLASISTIIRLPYISFYAKNDNYLHNVANITLWSIFESGTGIIAGSLPSMKLLLKRWVKFDSSKGETETPRTPFTGTNKATVTSRIGASGRAHKGLRSATGNRDWEPLDDAASSHKIYVKVDVEMQSLETSGRSAGSTDEI